MNLCSPDESLLMDVVIIREHPKGIVPEGKIMGAMPMKAVLRPKELRAAFKLRGGASRSHHQIRDQYATTPRPKSHHLGTRQEPQPFENSGHLTRHDGPSNRRLIHNARAHIVCSWAANAFGNNYRGRRSDTPSAGPCRSRRSCDHRGPASRMDHPSTTSSPGKPLGSRSLIDIAREPLRLCGRGCATRRALRPSRYLAPSTQLPDSERARAGGIAA